MCGDRERLYLTNKNQRNTPERLELKIFTKVAAQSDFRNQEIGRKITEWQKSKIAKYNKQVQLIEQYRAVRQELKAQGDTQALAKLIEGLESDSFEETGYDRWSSARLHE